MNGDTPRTDEEIRQLIIDNSTKDPNGCWIWNGAITSRGYGAIWHNKTSASAHRLSYQAFKNSSATGLYVCHTCDTPSCVNPEHLFLGTGTDNQNDSYQKGRNSNAKLSNEKIDCMRRLVSLRITYSQIAKILNITPSLITYWKKKGFNHGNRT